MATPRKRWFRVADKILRKQWSNDQLAALVRLMAYLNGRWAREGIPNAEAGYAEIGIVDLMLITGKRRADVARKSAERLADIASMSVQHRGEVSVILWHKFPEFQGLVSDPGEAPTPEISPSATRDTRHATEERQTPPHSTNAPESGSPSGSPEGNPSAPRSRRPRKPQTDPPEELSPGDYEKVRKHFELVSPGCVALDLDGRIEAALRYYRREGRQAADWAATVIDNITALENRARERRGESKMRSAREAREIQKARAGNGSATAGGVGS